MKNCLFILIFAFLTVRNLNAVEQIEIESNPDTAYLSYEFNEFIYENWAYKQKPIQRPAHVLKIEYTDFSKGFYMRVYNPHIITGGNAIFSLKDLSQSGKSLGDISINLTISDWVIYNDSSNNNQFIVGGGYKNDSAYIFTLNLETGDFLKAFLINGIDSIDNGSWDPLINVLLLGDFDRDEQQEVYVYVNGDKDFTPRKLFCVELPTLDIKWSLPYASVLEPAKVNYLDSHQGSLINIVSFNAKNGVADSIFNDQYGYFTIINSKGEILFNRIIASRSGDMHVVKSNLSQHLYLEHEIKFAIPEQYNGDTSDVYQLSKVTYQGDVIKTIELPYIPADIWQQSSFNKYNNVLLTCFHNGIINIYDTDLNLIAISNKTKQWEYLGKMNLCDYDDSVLVFWDGIYSRNLEKLSTFPFKATYFEPAGYDNAGKVNKLLIGVRDKFYLGELSKKSIVRLLSIFYHRNQSYILMLLSGLFVALISINFYRRKNKKNFILIANQKAELEKTHKALQKAQETIVEQEKYKQAKDIAGGFAHEIRNALYPVDIILTKMRLLDDISSIEKSKFKEYLKNIDVSVGKAVDLTELISQYTKLDSECLPEQVNFGSVIKEILNSNRLLISNSGINIDYNDASDYSVLGNHKQLSIVINNLLLNSIDALSSQKNPTISINITSTDDYVEMYFSDNGVGIEPENVKRIFNTFYSTKPDKGKGIGLSLSKKIIEMYGGEIDVKSTLNQGTTFILRLKRNNNEGKDINS